MDQVKTPKDHVLDALRRGDSKQITAYLNKYYKDVVGYYQATKEDEGSRGQVEGKRTQNTAGGDRTTNGQDVLDRVEEEANKIFGE